MKKEKTWLPNERQEKLWHLIDKEAKLVFADKRSGVHSSKKGESDLYRGLEVGELKIVEEEETANGDLYRKVVLKGRWPKDFKGYWVGSFSKEVNTLKKIKKR